MLLNILKRLRGKWENVSNYTWVSFLCKVFVLLFLFISLEEFFIEFSASTPKTKIKISIIFEMLLGEFFRELETC